MTGFLPLWHPKPAPISSSKIVEQECLIFICIYNLPPIQVFREDTKSYYRYFGWSTLKRLCPSYLRNGRMVNVRGLRDRLFCASQAERSSKIRASVMSLPASKFGYGRSLCARSEGESSWPKPPINVPTPTVPVRCLPERSIAARLAPTPLKAAAVLTAAPVRIRYVRAPWRRDVSLPSELTTLYLPGPLR